jgi:CheY-like chemotaxis protein
VGPADGAALGVRDRHAASARGRRGGVEPPGDNPVSLPGAAFVKDRAECFTAGMNDFINKPLIATRYSAK